jgi:ligand-binding sensor domain-containing protein
VDSGLSSREIHSLTRGGSGELYVGTADGVFGAASPGGPWTAYGMKGHVVHDLLAVDGRLVVATYDGVFFADPGGVWSELPGLAQRWPISLALDHQGRLLVGTDGRGLHRAVLPWR